jgi:hypothetical protein
LKVPRGGAALAVAPLNLTTLYLIIDGLLVVLSALVLWLPLR